MCEQIAYQIATISHKPANKTSETEQNITTTISGLAHAV